MRRTFAALVTAAVLAAAGSPPAVAGDGSAPPAPVDDLSTALERAVDLPDPAARAKAAKSIAARPEATIDTLVSAMRVFGTYPPAEPSGPRTVKVPLWDGKAEVATEVTVYVPPGYVPTKPAPLLLALHGAGGDGRGEHLMWKDTADALGMLVVAPTDPNSEKGYEYTDALRTKTLSALRWARRHFDVDENRVVCTGISRGGHFTWDLALRHPDVFAAIAPMIGGPRLANARGENNIRYLENLRCVPIRDLQGEGDDALLVANLRIAFERLAWWKATDARLLVQPGMAHAFDASAVDWKAWLGAVRRDPAAAQVVRRTLGPPEGRAFWAEVLAIGSGAKSEIKPVVDPKSWNALSADEQRRAFVRYGDDVTARLEVRRTAPGAFEAEAQDVTRFRLLLADGMFDPAKPVTVQFRGKSQRFDVRRDPAVLLADFVERFDRTYLPVAEVVVR